MRLRAAERPSEQYNVRFGASAVMSFFRNLFKKPDKWIAVDVELDGMHPSHIIQLSFLMIEGRRIRGKNFYFPARAINR